MGSTVEAPHAGLMGMSSPKQPASLGVHTFDKLQEVHLGGGIERLCVARECSVRRSSQVAPAAAGSGSGDDVRHVRSRHTAHSCRVYTLPPTGPASQMSPVGRLIVYLNPHPLHATL